MLNKSIKDLEEAMLAMAVEIEVTQTQMITVMTNC